MHLTLKKQVINSCYPGWRLLLLAFIFRRGERFILAELWLLVRDTERGEHARRLGRRSYGEGEGGTAEPGLQKDGGDGDSSQSGPCFQLQRSPRCTPQLCCPGPRLGTQRAVRMLRRGDAERCRLLCARCPAREERCWGAAWGPQCSPETQRSVSLWGTDGRLQRRARQERLG